MLHYISVAFIFKACWRRTLFCGGGPLGHLETGLNPAVWIHCAVFCTADKYSYRCKISDNVLVLWNWYIHTYIPTYTQSYMAFHFINPYKPLGFGYETCLPRFDKQ